MDAAARSTLAATFGGGVNPQNTVLVVDDEPLVLRMVATILASAGFQVTAVASGLEALRLVETHTYSLVVTDVRMPIVSGPEFARRMRYTDAPRLLFMSGAACEPLNALLRHGAGFIKKPFRSNELLSAVAQQMQRK